MSSNPHERYNSKASPNDSLFKLMNYSKTSKSTDHATDFNGSIYGAGRFRELKYRYGWSFGTQIKRSLWGDGPSVEVVGKIGFTVYIIYTTRPNEY